MFEARALVEQSRAEVISILLWTYMSLEFGFFKLRTVR